MAEQETPGWAAKRKRGFLLKVVAARGNVELLARRMGHSRRQIVAALRDFDLEEEAARLRALHGVSGKRTLLKRGSADAAAEEKKIRAALAEHKSQVAAANALGMGRTRLQRAMKRLGI